jgi:hypothetical protein
MPALCRNGENMSAHAARSISHLRQEENKPMHRIFQDPRSLRFAISLNLQHDFPDPEQQIP